MNPIGEIVGEKRIIVCAGSGGVGKTTIAAAIALREAVRGKKVALVTIDPARRLATSLGLEQLSNHPTRIDTANFRRADLTPEGELHAMMLDAKSTFDEIVRRFAAGPRQADQIIANRFYRNISATLSGTQEYMAMEKLYELHSENLYDLIVIDTPPTRNALDFLDSPRRLTDFFDSRVLKWFLLPYARAGGGIMRLANVAAMSFLKIVQRIVGSEVLRDTAEFFSNLEGMYDGFKQRAGEVAGLLQSRQTSFVVVTSPGEEAVSEAIFFTNRLNEAHLPFGALVVNRIHPHWGNGIQVRERSLMKLRAGDPVDRLLADLLRNEQSFERMTRMEDETLSGLAHKIPRHCWVKVPWLETEAVDFPGLVDVARRLFAEPGSKG